MVGFGACRSVSGAGRSSRRARAHVALGFRSPILDDRSGRGLRGARVGIASCGRRHRPTHSDQAAFHRTGLSARYLRRPRGDWPRDPPGGCGLLPARTLGAPHRPGPRRRRHRRAPGRLRPPDARPHPLPRRGRRRRPPSRPPTGGRVARLPLLGPPRRDLGGHRPDPSRPRCGGDVRRPDRRARGRSGGSGRERGGGAEVIRAFAGKNGPRFLALSVSDAAEDVVSVVRSGARGYVTKSINRKELSRWAAARGI